MKTRPPVTCEPHSRSVPPYRDSEQELDRVLGIVKTLTRDLDRKNRNKRNTGGVCMCQQTIIVNTETTTNLADPDPLAAQAMIDAFASVAAHRVDRFYGTLQRKAVDYRHDVPAKDLRRWVPKNLAWAASHQFNLIIRPRSTETFLIQLDDLSQEKLDRLRPVAFLGLETSPGNYQAWVALPTEECDQDFVPRLKKGVGADENASGAVRIAGSINFKEKYAPNFPRVQLVHVAPGLITSRAQLEALGVVAVPQPGVELSRAVPQAAPAAVPGTANLADIVVTVGPRRRRQPRRWPNYDHTLSRAELNRDGTALDRSGVDFTWCMTAIDWGWGVEDTAERLTEVSEKAQENGREYAIRTAQNAAAAVERNRRHAG
jgi:hypothetical protein